MDALQALTERRTIRLFQPRHVADADLAAIINCARVTSCASNLQPLRYVVIRTAELLNRVLAETAWARLVAPQRTPEPGKTAPAAFIAILAPADAKPITYADAGAAIQSMQTAAWSLGLGCCWLGAIQRQNLHQILRLADDRQVLFLLAVGYPAEQPTSEDVPANASIAYYLDDDKRLHVPKIRLEDLVDWR
ncbi:MAG: nitroreductase family protein [Lentisphaeria bacterium]|nr:nitroreductase family protein [Lentisphaeria bacterium]